MRIVDEDGTIKGLPGGDTRLSMSFVGDVCLWDKVEEGVAGEGPMFPFRNVADVLRTTDVRVGNLEGNIYRNPDLVTNFYGEKRHLKTSAKNAAGLAELPFNIMTLANNHITDAGPATLQETIEFLDEHGILYTGAGADNLAARIPAILEWKGGAASNKKKKSSKSAGKKKKSGKRKAAKKEEPFRVGVLAYQEGTGGWKGKFATPVRPGAARLKEDDIVEDIARLRPKVNAVIVVLHADLEFVDYPAPWRVELSHRLIEAGVTMLVEGHPHVPQGLEAAEGTLIAYSMGNFVFSLGDYQKNGSPMTSMSFILQAGLGDEGVTEAKVVPVALDEHGTPFVLEGQEKANFLEHMNAISQDIMDPKVLRERYNDTCRRYAGIYWGWTRGAFRSGGLKGFYDRMLPGFFREERLHWLQGYLEMLVGGLRNR